MRKVLIPTKLDKVAGELLQATGCYEYIIQYLEDRGVHYSTVES